MEKAYTLSAPPGRPSTPSEAVDFVIATGLKLGASDIHLGPCLPTQAHPDKHLLRYRVYGKLQSVRAPFVTPIYTELVSRLKVIAGMSSTEVGVPLDGQLNIDLGGGKSCVLRISIVPGSAGEEVVIRIQRGTNTNFKIDQLQMTDEMRNQLRKIVQQKSGMIVLNGPAGSGKTTTIYSMINTLAAPEKKIITAEDPVESRLPYVNHTQVTSRAGFADLSRAFMRQDADVIFIGEIRDEESAQTALQLAQTGHLVVTSLHSRDAVGVISRLEALGVHPNAIATTLICSLGQRLVPALCAACKVPMVPDQPTIDVLNTILNYTPEVKMFKAGPGCDKCVKGYSGRIPIFELLVISGEISDAINAKRPRSQIMQIAREKGMATLAEEAVLRLYLGLTDLDSVQSYIASAEQTNT